MLIDSLYILQNTGETLIQKNFSDANKDVIIQEFLSYYTKNSETAQEIYPILNIKKFFCAYLTSSDLIYVLIFTRDNNLGQIFEIAHMIGSLLEETFEELNAAKVRKNSLKIIQMIDRYLCNGYPIISDKLVLKKSLVEPGILTNLQNAIKNGIQNGIRSSEKQSDSFESYFDSLNDIRKENWSIKTGCFEDVIYFDVCESLDIIVDRDGNTIHEEINGEIKFSADISKPVDISLYLSTTSSFKTATYHDALLDNIEEFENDKTLHFTMPQGKGTLINYQIEKPNARVPFDLSHSIKYQDDGVYIELTIRHIPIRGTLYNFDDFHGKFFLPPELCQRECSATKGLIRYNDKKSTLLWKVGEFSKQETVKLNLKFALEGNKFEELAPIVLALKFKVDLYSFSGTKIDRATFKDPTCKYGKKARAISKAGTYEIRLT